MSYRVGSAGASLVIALVVAAGAPGAHAQKVRSEPAEKATPTSIQGVKDPAPPGATTPAVGLPAAADLFEKHIAAIGGREKIEAMKNRIVKGTVDVPSMGLKAVVTLWYQAPNSFKISQIVPDRGSEEKTYNGQVGWGVVNGKEPTLLGEDEVKELRDDAQIYGEVNYKDRYIQIETVEKGSFEGREAYKVRALDQNGVTKHMFFDAESGLLLGFERAVTSPAGEVQATFAMSDYQEHGGIKFPMKFTQRAMGQEAIVTFDSVEVDAQEMPNFDPPPEAKKREPGK